jgi:hypothetical protein
VRQGAHRRAGLCIRKARRPRDEVNFGPFEREHFAAPPTSESKEPHRRRGDRLFFRQSAQGIAEGSIFGFRQASASLSIRAPLDASNRIVRPQATADREGKYAAEQADGSRRPAGYALVKPLDVRAGDGCYL